MKYFFIGILLAFSSALLSMTIWDVEMAIMVTGGIGLFFFGLSMISLGTLSSGDRVRVQFLSESVGERRQRIKTSSVFLLVGLPNLLIGACIFYFSI